MRLSIIKSAGRLPAEQLGVDLTPSLLELREHVVIRLHPKPSDPPEPN
jgi:hypothetical protein